MLRCLFIMANDIHLYCLSNGSETIFPENTLTKFQSKLPFQIEWKKQDWLRWYVAIEAIGFDPNFSTTYLPKNDAIPTMILITTPVETNGENISKQDSICVGLDKMPDTCIVSFLDERFKKNTSKFKKETTKVRELKIPGTEDDPDSFHLFRVIPGTGWFFEFSDFTYYFQENTNYNTRRYYSYIKNLETLLPVKITYDPKYFLFEIHSNSDKRIDILTHSVLHNNIGAVVLKEFDVPKETWTPIKNQLYTIKTDSYIGYTITKTQYLQIDIKQHVQIKIPEVVKVKCSFIRDQVFNNTQEKDLVCFSPKFTLQSKYCFYEVESKNFLQLSNTILDSLDFKLVDGDNKRLQLREGTPTLIKLHFKKMEANKKSFHVRISSGGARNGSNSDNDMSKFTVKLPQTLYFNREWKVALSSILIPGRYCTLPEAGEIKFTYKHEGEVIVHKDYFPMREMTKEDVIEFISDFFSSHVRKIGSVTEKLAANEYEPTLEFRFYKEGFFTLSDYACQVLGYGAEDFTNRKKRFDIKFKPNETMAKLKMSYGINLNYFRPNYIMAYANIVEPTPVNAEMTNLLKVFQISGDKSHLLYEFKHLEYHRLLNDIVNEIQIELRTHTGELVSFEKRSTTQVIVNLLFTNY